MREAIADNARFLAMLAATLLAALVAALVAVPVVSVPAQAAFPGTTGKVSFARNGDIWTTSADGSGGTRLTTDYNVQGNPAVSPDGSRVAYESLRGIWAMNADGSGRRELTNGDSTDEDPTWSPEGARIAFSRGADIWTMNADGSGQRNVTSTPDRDEFDPAWSPSDDRIAYTSACEPNSGATCIFVMNAGGTARANLTPEDSLPQCPNQPGYYHDGASRQPAWSPDGTKIAFSGALICPHVLGKDIWVMGANGGGKTNLTDDENTSDLRPAFSPDGTRIVFESDRGSTTGRVDLFAISATGGSGPTPVTTSARDADWSVARPACTETGTAGNDTINGTPGSDVICGLGGADRINGLGGNDILLGDGGDDVLLGASGMDTLNGGAGSDTASFAGSSAPVNASLTAGFARKRGTGTLESAALAGVENLTGSPLGDTLSGSAAANILTGGGGADTLLGLAGDDSLVSRDGVNSNDSLDGGAGTDRCTSDASERSIKGCE